MNPADLPALNATLNAAATVCLIAGFVAIKRRRFTLHGWLMSITFVLSTLFLIGYLTHKFHRGDVGIVVKTAFPNLAPWLRYLYYLILFPHLLLAMVMLPIIILTFVRAYQRNWEKHRRIAKITFPVWLYVSITGVVIYWMLYHLFPTMNAR